MPITPTQRHHIMASIHSADTKPEIVLRHELWRRGFRYRVNDRRLPGSPDVVLPRYTTVVFVHGCFWHGHNGCDKYVAPKSNTDFWINKIEYNKERDQRNYNDLHGAGWHVIVIWECQLKKTIIESTMHDVEHMLSKNLLELYKP